MATEMATEMETKMETEITDLEMFNIIKTNFTSELYDWMKIEFSDVCSNGDLCVNELLDELNSVYNLKNKTEISNKIEMEYIFYIYDTYICNYLNGKKPNPLWAD